MLLRIYLFQCLQVETSSEQIIDLGSPTTRSLFAYLVLHRGRPLDRRQLAFRFWPRTTESAARRNLRQYLHRIRRALEPVDPQGAWLFSNGNVVQFAAQDHIWLDVDVFRQKTHPDANPTELQEAVDLYRGDMLEDVYEDWCVETRQELHQLYLSALQRLSQALQEMGLLDAAEAPLQKWFLAEPLNETAHRQLMNLYALRGDRHLLVRHYQQLVETLKRELNTQPLSETQTLFQALQTGEFPSSDERIKGTRSPVGLYAHNYPVGIQQPVEQKGAGILAVPPVSQRAIPIVGRQQELADLQEMLLNARQGRGGFLLVTGESGVGKTRLVHEYLAQFPGLPVIKVGCHEFETMLPYAPLRNVLHQAVDLLPISTLQPPPAWFAMLLGIAPDLAKRFPYISSRPISPGEVSYLQGAMISLVLRVVEQAAPQPLHIILDDVHWGDGATWHFLAQLAQVASTHRLQVIGLCRQEDLAAEARQLLRSLERNNLLLQISLQRLSTEEAAALAAHLLPEQKSDPILLQRLYRETEGNPFFIIEIVRAIQELERVENCPLPVAIQRLGTGLPISMQRVIEARLDRLSPASQELLAAAAVIDRGFDFSLLQHISQLKPEETVSCIEEWLQRGLVREEAGGYDFSHEKIQQVAYARLSRARRQYLHDRVAAALEEALFPVEATTLAHHYGRGAQPIKALPYLTKAGEQSLHSRAYEQARQFGLQAISLLSSIPGPRQRHERIDLNLQLAQAYAFTGDLRHAQEILNETENLALNLGDEIRLAHLFHRSAQIFWLQGQPETAGDYARRMLRAAEEQSDPNLLQAALRMLGRVGIALAAFDDAIAYLLRYISLENNASPPPDLPIVFGYLGVAYTRVGAWGKALEAAQRGVNLAEAAVQQVDVSGYPLSSRAVDFARMQLAFVYADMQDWQTCLEVLQPVSDPLSSGEQEGQEEKISAALQTLPSLTPLGFMILGLRGLARANLGEPQIGIFKMRIALNWAEQTNYRVFHYLPRKFLAQALLLVGDIPEATRQAESALEQARAAGNRWAVGVIDRLMAEILTHHPTPQWTHIENYLIDSMHLLRQVRARPDLARTYLALRKLYDRAGQIAWAVDCHYRAVSLFEEMGMMDELRQAQGRAAGDRRGAVVIPGLALRGPNIAAKTG